MRQNNLITFSLILLSFYSCKKEEIPATHEGIPEFYSIFTIGGEYHKYEAGRNGYFMETSFIDEEVPNVHSGVLVMSGVLKNLAAATSSSSLKIYIRNYTYTGSSNYDSDIFLSPRAYDFRGAATPQVNYQVDFTADPKNPAGSSFVWNFGDDSEIIRTNTHNVSHTYKNPEKLTYNVCLSVISSFGDSSLICSDIYLENASCEASFTVDTTGIGPAHYTFDAEHIGHKPVKYNWKFGTLPTSHLTVSKKIEYNYQTIPPVGYERVCLTTTDITGCETTHCENVIIGNSLVSNIANFVYNDTTLTVPNTLDFSKVIIEYTDENGVVYTSYSDILDHTNSTFEILEKSKYKNDRNGNHTAALKIKASCDLYSPIGIVRLEIQDAKMAVAYP